MIKKVLRSLLINAVALYIASIFISGFHLTSNLQSILIITLVFTVIHLFIKPLLEFILGPINFLTFGLVSFALDVAILYAISVLFPGISFTHWTSPAIYWSIVAISSYNLNAIGTTIVTAATINIVRMLLNYLSS